MKARSLVTLLVFATSWLVPVFAGSYEVCLDECCEAGEEMMCMQMEMMDDCRMTKGVTIHPVPSAPIKKADGIHIALSSSEFFMTYPKRVNKLYSLPCDVRFSHLPTAYAPLII